MIRAMAILVALVGCGDGVSGQDPHALTDCDPSVPSGGGQCELACAEAVTPTGAGCNATATESLDATHSSEISIRCDKTFEFEGARGCCVRYTSGFDVDVHFAECE